jgi:hypothetical protein
VTAFATFSKILISFCSSFWRPKAVAVVAGQEWVQAMEAAAREAEVAAAPVGAGVPAAPAVVYGKRASHPRQAEDRLHHLAVVVEVREAERDRAAV